MVMVKVEDNLDNIRVGVIGAGYWGPNLIRNFAQIPDADLVVVADKRDDRLQHVMKTYPDVQTTNDYTDFFSLGLDAVVIATPPATHHPIAKDCLEHGLHAFIEKPLTLNSEDGQDLVDMADANDLRLMVGHVFEYNAAVRKIKEIIDSGELGDIYYINAVRVNLGLYQQHLNVMWDLAPHDLSILLYLLGEMPISVTAQGGDRVFEGIHDIAYMHLEFPSKVLAHVHVSWLDPNKERRITIVGSKKMLVYDDIEQMDKIKLYDKGVEAPPYTDTYADFQCSYRYGDITTPRLDLVEPLRAECQHFLDSIAQGKTPQSDGRVGLHVVQLLEMAERSLQNGGVKEVAADAAGSL